jgi:hypothetical protein
MAFVIVRPGGLTNDPASGNGVLTESTSVAGSISREDVAALVVKALLSKKTDGKVRVLARLGEKGKVVAQARPGALPEARSGLWRKSCLWLTLPRFCVVFVRAQNEQCCLFSR